MALHVIFSFTSFIASNYPILLAPVHSLEMYSDLCNLIYNSREISKPLRLSIPFRAPQDGVLEEGLSLAYEPVPVKSSVAPSGLCLTESEGNPEEIVSALGFLDGIEFPTKKR